MLSTLRYAIAGISLLFALSSVAFAQDKNPIVKSGNYVVELRIPPNGLFAGEETDIEFRLTDASKADPVLGAPGVIRATVKGQVTMPSMASMPPAIPRIHSEGVPGDYGIVTTFPHGGEYQIALNIAPPGNATPFQATFLVEVNDADASGKRKKMPAPYFAALKSNPGKPTAGQPVTLTLNVIERATNKPVTAFDIVHEQKMHLIIVRDDLGAFFHEHPDVSADGTFTHTFTFPTGGNWRLFCDTAPAGAGSQVLPAPLKVDGPTITRTPLTLSPDAPIQVDGLTLGLPKGKLIARKTLPFTLSLNNSEGKPVTDLQPWLGAIAHLILIESDASTFVHSHPDESKPNNGRNGSLTFLVRFPKPGIYKGWVQCQQNGVVKTIPFVVRATGEAITR